MSLQDATDVSAERKSSSVDPSASTPWYRFRNDGSLHDRLLTAMILLVGAVSVSVCALVVPYGRFLSVVFAGWIAAMSVFEVVRLFARHHATTAYRPLWGALLFVVLLGPSIGALEGAVQGVISGSIALAPVYLTTIGSAVSLMVLLVVEGRSDLKRAQDFSSGLVVSFLLLGFCVPMLVLLSGVSDAILLLWWLIGVVALNDTAAYFVGRACGKKRLAPALSPNKTVEGSVAGLIVGVLAGLVLWELLLDFLISPWWLAVLSFAVVCMAQCGDLAKSYVKRVRGVKDFGALLPGHGGVLDRFDALITAAPIVFITLVCLEIVRCK
jgi:phosphatidate cytidylyltransferase